MRELKIGTILKHKITHEYILIVESGSAIPYYVKGNLNALKAASKSSPYKLTIYGVRSVLYTAERKNYTLLLPTKEECDMSPIDLTQEQLNEMHLAVQEALGDPNSDDQVEDLDLQLAMWEVAESFGIANHDIGLLIKTHGEQIIGETLAKQLIGIL